MLAAICLLKVQLCMHVRKHRVGDIACAYQPGFVRSIHINSSFQNASTKKALYTPLQFQGGQHKRSLAADDQSQGYQSFEKKSELNLTNKIQRKSELPFKLVLAS